MANETRADLTPHPLVPQVALGLAAAGVPLVNSAQPLVAAVQIAADEAAQDEENAPEEVLNLGEHEAKFKKAQAARQISAREEKPPDTSRRRDPDVETYGALVLAGASDVPSLVTFAGYVGARFDERKANWIVFYLDTRLASWLLVQTIGIVYRDPVEDHNAPCNQRDVIWVKADTPVGLGDGSQAVQAQFLTGEFTRAADFDAPTAGGTMAASTGVFCEARSVGCCRPRTNNLTRP